MVAEEFFFHMSKTNLLELELSSPGGFEALSKKIVASNDNKEIFGLFKKIVLLAIGRKSDDGKKFIKNAEIQSEFENSEAFGELIFELMSNSTASTEFVNGLFPATMQQAVKAAQLEGDDVKVIEEPRTLTREEISEMDSDELRSGLATGKYVIGS